MLRPGIDTATVWHAHHHRHRHLASEHEARLGGLIDKRIHRQRHEVHEHDLDHWAQSRHGSANGGTDDGGLGNGRVAHALWTKSF